MPLEREFHSLSWKLKYNKNSRSWSSGTKRPHSAAKGKEGMATIMGSRVRAAIRKAWVSESEVTVAQSCPTLFDPWTVYSSWNSPVQNTGVGSLSLLQGLG